MDAQQFREAAHAAIEDVINYHETLASHPVVAPVSPGYLAPQLPDSAPSSPQPWAAVQADVDRCIKPGLTKWQHPGFMAFFPSNVSYPSMIGELYSAAFNAPAFNWQCSPAITELETVVMDWLARMLALPPCFLSAGEGGGVIQGSASEAIVVTVVAARDRFVRRRCDAEGLKPGTRERERREGQIKVDLVLLASDQAHSLAHKAAIIAGTPFRTAATRKEDGFALKGESLRRAIDDCRAEGLEPYFVCITLGTTSTCAVDDFAEISNVLVDHPDVWSHVDAAYAGSALILEEYQHLSRMLSKFDSFDFNLHKWLLVNFDASCLYVRRRADLIDALSITPSYLRNKFSDSGLVTDYRDWQIPLGRRFRSLKIWFVLRCYGVDALKSIVRGHVELGLLFADLIRSRGDLFDIFAEPRFALTTFTVKAPASLPVAAAADGVVDASVVTADDAFTPDAEARHQDRANALTRDVYESVNAQGEVFITNTVVKGVYVIRIVSASLNTQESWLRKCFDILVKTTEGVLAAEKEMAKVQA